MISEKKDGTPTLLATRTGVRPLIFRLLLCITEREDYYSMMVAFTFCMLVKIIQSI